jgi:multimeric flavodoxin WrbA
LAIIGSLRKANTYEIIRKIEIHHNDIYGCEYEYLFLKDANLKLCQGCHLCISKGESLCPLKDDRDLIIEKIERADGIILASPNYAMNVPWLMKNFIDRFAYTLHRPIYFGKKFMILINSGSYMGVKSALKLLSVIVSGGTIVNRACFLTSPGMNENKVAFFEKSLKKTAKSFAANMVKKSGRNPPFGYLIWFSAFKATSEANRNEVADHEFFKNKRYFIDIELTGFQSLTIAVFTRLFGFLIKHGVI